MGTMPMRVGTFMRRAMALATATAAWVLLIQVASIAMAPPVVVELAPVDVARTTDPSTVDETFELTLSPTDPALIVLPANSGSATTTTQRFPTVTVASSTTTTTVPATTTTANVPASTTTSPAITTTAAPATTSTTAAVTTTAPPATTTSAAPVTTAATVAGGFSAPAESEFLAKVNGLRASVGVAALSANGELNNYARWWAKQMADSGNFSHSDIGSLLDPWSLVGENIGYGPSVTTVFNALVGSTGHYNNMVDGRFTSIGVGAFIDATGRIWTAHVFGG